MPSNNQVFDFKTCHNRRDFTVKDIRIDFCKVFFNGLYFIVEPMPMSRLPQSPAQSVTSTTSISPPRVATLSVTREFYRFLLTCSALKLFYFLRCLEQLQDKRTLRLQIPKVTTVETFQHQPLIFLRERCSRVLLTLKIKKFR